MLEAEMAEHTTNFYTFIRNPFVVLRLAHAAVIDLETGLALWNVSWCCLGNLRSL